MQKLLKSDFSRYSINYVRRPNLRSKRQDYRISRVLDVEGPKIEATSLENGKLKGEIETLDMVTYWSVPRSGGAYYAEGKGVFMTKDGSGETATWTRQGIAHYSGLKRKDVGSVFCRTSSSSTTSSPTGKLAFLHNLVRVFEYEVDENGNSGGKIWE